jgi:hypothetical protein
MAFELLEATQPNKFPQFTSQLRRKVMTRSQRIAAAVVGALMLCAGFAFGRFTNNNNGAETPVAANQLLSNVASTVPTTAALNTATATVPNANDNQTFYLKDFKTGYDDGYQAGQTNQTGNLIATERAGYNDGFKEGYADGMQKQQVSNVPVAIPAVHRVNQRAVYYQPVRSRGKRRSSKVRTALTIAGPAAVGAGVGVLAGGKKGAAVGALLGGGGGALYHLFKNRN